MTLDHRLVFDRIFRIYRTGRYGDNTYASRSFPSAMRAVCTQEQAENLAAALSNYGDAGCEGQYLVECPDCLHNDVSECYAEHVWDHPKQKESL